MTIRKRFGVRVLAFGPLLLLLGALLPFGLSPDRVVGGVLPHHLAAKAEIGRYFEALSKQTPKVVVLIGPNHLGRGTSNILVDPKDYRVGSRTMKANPDLIRGLTASGLVKAEEIPFTEEFSISNLAPFIQKTFPGTRFIPLILKVGTSPEDAERLGLLLHKILPEDSLVLASVDFSHYQPELVAEFHDQTSLATIQNFDFANLYNLEVDSPPSLMAVMGFLRARGAERLVSHRRTSSATLSGRLSISDENTSHQFFKFAKGDAARDLGVSFLFFGDAIFDRGVQGAAAVPGHSNPLADLEGQEGRFFRGNHSNLLNLEGPIDAEGKAQKKEIVFNNDKALTLSTLKNGYFNLVNTANNHRLDYFESGARKTIDILLENGIGSFGYPDPCVLRRQNGFSIAFCGFVDDGAVSSEEMLETVASARPGADRVVVSVHWGTELYGKANSRQIRLARQFIDQGADLVIGHHPHVIQPFEVYRGKPIVYSLGNFIFDPLDKAALDGLGLGVFFSGAETSLYFYPIRLGRFGPKLLEYDQRKKFYEKYLGGVETDPGLAGKVVLGEPRWGVFGLTPFSF